MDSAQDHLDRLKSTLPSMEAMEALCDLCDDAMDMVQKLMGDLASLRNLYEEATCLHPDDDVRIFTLDYTEASIMKARKFLYG